MASSLCLSLHPFSILKRPSSDYTISHSAPPPQQTIRRTGLNNFSNLQITRGLTLRKRFVVRMAPDEERMTQRNPLDFPIEWIRPKNPRRPDVFPQFSPMKTPIPPPPVPNDPSIEEDEEEEQQKEEEEQEQEEDLEEPEYEN